MGQERETPAEIVPSCFRKLRWIKLVWREVNSKIFQLGYPPLTCLPHHLPRKGLVGRWYLSPLSTDRLIKPHLWLDRFAMRLQSKAAGEASTSSRETQRAREDQSMNSHSLLQLTPKNPNIFRVCFWLCSVDTDEGSPPSLLRASSPFFFLPSVSSLPHFSSSTSSHFIFAFISFLGVPVFLTFSSFSLFSLFIECTEARGGQPCVLAASLDSDAGKVFVCDLVIGRSRGTKTLFRKVSLSFTEKQFWGSKYFLCFYCRWDTGNESPPSNPHSLL